MVSDGNHEDQPREVAKSETVTPAEESAPFHVTEEPAVGSAHPVAGAETSEDDETAAEKPAAPVTARLSSQGKLWASLAALVVVFAVALAGITGLVHGKKSAGAAAPPPAGAVPTQPPPPTAVVSGGSVAAVVNGHSIPMSDYHTLLNFAQRRTAGQPGITAQTLGPQVMNQLVATELIREYATAHHIGVSSTEVDRQVQSQAQQLGGQKVFLQRLDQVGLTLAQYRALVASSLLGQKVENRVAPLRTTAAKPVPVAHVRHILIAFHPQGNPGQKAPATRSNATAKAKAQAILNQVLHGGNFAALAKKNSDDPGSAATGGDLGNVYSGQTVPEFNHAAFTAPLHHPTMVRTVYGYHIVEVLSRGKGVPPSQNPQQAAQQAQQQQFNSWLGKQMKAARIQRIAKVEG